MKCGRKCQYDVQFVLHIQDGLIQQCGDVMKETTNGKSVCGYHQAAGMYGQIEVQRNCIDWLEKNLMTSQSTNLLRDIR